MPYPYINLFINNKTPDTIILAGELKVKLNYFDVPLQQSQVLDFPCNKSCYAMAPNKNRFQNLLNREFVFWLESGVGEVFNDSLPYKYRCHVLFSNSFLDIDFLGHNYRYKIESSDIIYVSDCTLYPGHDDKDIRERYKMEEKSRFPLERIHIK
ncbi:MAG: hypothetical protein IPM47_11555 [Sphingobacteriales bacterium]|nr:MAG: hypothetical protein IPM47_11555 [Sphingobacteriales bacterium]